MDYVINPLKCIFILYCWITTILFLLAFTRGKEFDWEIYLLNRRYSVNYAVFVGAMLGTTLFFMGGFEKVLFFIPDSFMASVNKDGVREGIKNTLIFILSVSMTFLLMDFVNKMHKLRKK